MMVNPGLLPARCFEMKSRMPWVGYLRVLLVLGRVSNLPTVWSNCLAAWLLASGGSWGRFATLCLGATLFYSGGMFLNDAFDARFDRQYRPERPIPSGRISPRVVWRCGAATLGLGWLTILLLGRSGGAFALALLLAIVIYDAIHKRTPWAPVLMAVCRFLLYLMAASMAKEGVSTTVVWRALALSAYVVGVSYVARCESRPGAISRWLLALLSGPIVLAMVLGTIDQTCTWAVAVLLGAWMAWSLRRGLFRAAGGLSSSVAGLLAGIVLVDWLAAASLGQGRSPVFIGLFLLALILQRVAPAT
jgi:UbiA prenyltransferase family protein